MKEVCVIVTVLFHFHLSHKKTFLHCQEKPYVTVSYQVFIFHGTGLLFRANDDPSRTVVPNLSSLMARRGCVCM